MGAEAHMPRDTHHLYVKTQRCEEAVMGEQILSGRGDGDKGSAESGTGRGGRGGEAQQKKVWAEGTGLGVAEAGAPCSLESWDAVPHPCPPPSSQG